jgi:hypothetical protein
MSGSTWHVEHHGGDFWQRVILLYFVDSPWSRNLCRKKNRIMQQRTKFTINFNPLRCTVSTTIIQNVCCIRTPSYLTTFECSCSRPCDEGTSVISAAKYRRFLVDQQNTHAIFRWTFKAHWEVFRVRYIPLRKQGVPLFPKKVIRFNLYIREKPLPLQEGTSIGNSIFQCETTDSVEFKRRCLTFRYAVMYLRSTFSGTIWRQQWCTSYST